MLIAQVRQLSTKENSFFPLLKRETEDGVLQHHLASLLGMTEHALSTLISGMGLERKTLSRAEAKALKAMKIIPPQSRGGNFLSKNTIRQVLKVVQSEKARSIEQQLSSRNRRKKGELSQGKAQAQELKQVP